MNINSISTITSDSACMRQNSDGSVAIARTLTSNTEESSESKKALQLERQSAEDIQQDIETINAELESLNKSIRFSVDDSTKDVVVKVVDKDSGEIITQIPPKEVLELRERMQEMSGLFVEETV